MGNLSGFLAQNALKVENVKFVASKRFLDDKNKPIEWEIGCITSGEDEALRRACTKRVSIPGKRNMQTQEIDQGAYLVKLAAKCTVYPNLDDKELQDSYGVMGADALLKVMLTPGEFAEYLLKVQETNGFDTTFEERVDEVKN